MVDAGDLPVMEWMVAALMPMLGEFLLYIVGRIWRLARHCEAATRQHSLSVRVLLAVGSWLGIVLAVALAVVIDDHMTIPGATVRSSVNKGMMEIGTLAYLLSNGLAMAMWSCASWAQQTTITPLWLGCAAFMIWRASVPLYVEVPFLTAVGIQLVKGVCGLRRHDIRVEETVLWTAILSTFVWLVVRVIWCIITWCYPQPPSTSVNSTPTSVQLEEEEEEILSSEADEECTTTRPASARTVHLVAASGSTVQPSFLSSPSLPITVSSDAATSPFMQRAASNAAVNACTPEVASRSSSSADVSPTPAASAPSTAAATSAHAAANTAAGSNDSSRLASLYAARNWTSRFPVHTPGPLAEENVVVPRSWSFPDFLMHRRHPRTIWVPDYSSRATPFQVGSTTLESSSPSNPHQAVATTIHPQVVNPSRQDGVSPNFNNTLAPSDRQGSNTMEKGTNTDDQGVKTNSVGVNTSGQEAGSAQQDDSSASQEVTQVCPAAPPGRGTDDFPDWRRHPVTSTKITLKKSYKNAKARLSRTSEDLPSKPTNSSKRQLAVKITRGMAKVQSKLTPSCLTRPETV